MNEYIVHSVKTDEILALGTAKECTKQLGYSSVTCFYSQICSQRNRGRQGYPQRNKNIFITLLDKEEEKKNATDI